MMPTWSQVSSSSLRLWEDTKTVIFRSATSAIKILQICLRITGRVYTLIVKGDPKEAEKVLLTENPTIVDVLPLTLEEIFIYELGGVDYEVKDILL